MEDQESVLSLRGSFSRIPLLCMGRTVARAFATVPRRRNELWGSAGALQSARLDWRRGDSWYPI